jgi:hypothetical protein
MDNAELIKIVKRIRNLSNAIQRLSVDQEELYHINTLSGTIDVLAFNVAFELEKGVSK